jgi:uncharacterized protein
MQQKQNSTHFSTWYHTKTVLVTGATSGIGREIAKQLADFGCNVLICGRDKTALDSLEKELKTRPFHKDVVKLSVDFSDKFALQNLIDHINTNFNIDIIVNNAGFGHMGNFQVMPPEQISSMQEVNMIAVSTLCRAFLPRMVKKSDGGILNVGSIASFFATPGSALYGATKHFILGFTDALHQELLSTGIHVTGVYPGRTHSRFMERATNGKVKEWDKAMDPALVADLALRALRTNKTRVITGMDNKIKILIASILPLPMRLKMIYKK